MVECSHKQVIKKMKEVVASSKYLTLSCDEVTMIDNQLWVSIHYYMVQDWCCLLILIFLKQVAKGRGSNSPTRIIMGFLERWGCF